MGYMDRRDMRTYRGSFQGNGRLSGCMFHLVCMGLLVLAGLGLLGLQEDAPLETLDGSPALLSAGR